MDVDVDTPNSNADNGVASRKRRNTEKDASKVRLVPGPQREDFDQALGVNQQLTLENRQLHAQLEAAKKLQAEQAAFLNSMQHDLASKSQVIAEMQQHEGQMEAQFLGDQAKLQALYEQCNAMVPQLLESQKLLMKCNEDVERLNRLLVQKTDEAIQLRAYSHLQSKKNPRSTPPPRRGTRASLDPVRNSGRRTIKIPLDPIPVARAPGGESDPKPKSKLTATPAFADLLGTDVATLSGFIGQLERLLVNDDVTVNLEKTKSKKQKDKKATRPASRVLMTYIHAALRRATYDKFGVQQASDFQIYNPVDAAKVAACENGRGDPPADLFQWDFGTGYTQTRWNDLMVEKVVDAALEADGEDGEIAENGIERDLLEALMMEKLERYRAAWKGFQPSFDKDLGRMETIQEARARGTRAFEQHQLASRSTSSKTRACDIETWQRLLQLVERLGELGMSSEEEDEVEVDDTKIMIYRVKVCIWREPRVVEYLRFVDAQTAEFKKNQRGPTPASRMRGTERGSSKAPCGRPKSLYNSEWLKKATPAYLKELKVSKEVFGLFVAATDRMPYLACKHFLPIHEKILEKKISTSNPFSSERTLPAQSLQGVRYFEGHIRNSLGVFGVHFGDPNFLLDIPRPENAVAPGGYEFGADDFRHPLWLSPKFPYLVLLPRHNPFHGPLFSCLNVTWKNLPIQVLNIRLLGDEEEKVRWGLEQTLIDRWLNLESLLLLTLRAMTHLYGGPVAQGVYTFLNPISYRYSERNASSRQKAIDIALHSRDAFLPLMAKITLMFILLDARASGDWRAQMSKQTKLHHQWLVDLEHSVVGDFSIDRIGGIIDLTRSKSNPDDHIPRHARWLLPHLLGKHRVPLYLFYGQVFPLTELIPDALTKIGFVPDTDEVRYLQSLPGDVAFSPWSVNASVCTSRRPGAPPAASTSSHPPPTYQHSDAPIDSPLPAIPFPAVERDSGQRPGEDVHVFMERRRLHNEKRVRTETPQAKDRCLAQENNARKGGPPGKRGARVFIWDEEDGGFFVRRAYNRSDAADRWDEFTPDQRIYDSFSNTWDLCTALAPNQDAEPDEMYDNDNDNDDFHFHQPKSPTDLIPSIPDVPRLQAMEEETGERAAQVLEQAYNLDLEALREEADYLPGWRTQEVLSNIAHRFGFEECVARTSSSTQMEHKACAWAIGDESWTIPEASALPTFLYHLLEGDLKITGDQQGFQAELCDLTSPDSDLELDWNVDIEILGQGESTLYLIRPRHSETSGPSILLPSAATALQIVRSGWGPDFTHLICSIVELGAEFHPSWNGPASHRLSLILGVYVQRRDAFLHSPRGRAALFYGGIVGRLACLVIPNFEDLACVDPSEDILMTGARVVSRNGEDALWHETLTLEEINLICGGQRSSKAEDGQQLKFISWWPPPTAFYLSGLNTGWWNANCERWFVKRLKEIQSSSAKLHTYAEWKNKIRFSTPARKVSLKNNELCAQYLAARLH
ncbi:hypothetical protein B0H14DRAFT_2639770 [Mycena olivaceomarginata]|nr:hypothetical protein B0H14DRAFT_2639770 [Mycena olivaceomarginata]